MRGELKCDQIDFNDQEHVKRFINGLRTQVAQRDDTIFELKVFDQIYFCITGGDVPHQAGWYVICDSDHTPLYVGKAGDLSSRLNSKNGTRDNFANPERKSDSKQNFIKSLVDREVIGALEVLIITESEVCHAIGIEPPLSELDRGNVEKFIDLFRNRIVSAAV